MIWVKRLRAVLLVLMVVLPIAAERATAKEPSSPSDVLITAMIKRLLLMEGVAQYKWNNGVPIEDKDRERVVLDKVVAAAETQGVAVDFATDFFRAQITAAKAIQTDLFASWEQDGAGSFPDAPDLQTQVRPAIGGLTGIIIGVLALLDNEDGDELCALLHPVPEDLTGHPEAWHLCANDRQSADGSRLRRH
jgi:chorismate mutase-like protein